VKFIEGKTTQRVSIDMAGCDWTNYWRSEHYLSIVTTAFEKNLELPAYSNWISLLTDFQFINAALHRREPINDVDLFIFQQRVDRMRITFNALFDESHVTIYLHILFSGHAYEMLREHKSLWAFSQQSMEGLVKLYKHKKRRVTAHGGGKGEKRIPELLLLKMSRKLCYILNSGKSPNVVNPSALDVCGCALKKIIQEDRNKSLENMSKKRIVRDNANKAKKATRNGDVEGGESDSDNEERDSNSDEDEFEGEDGDENGDGDDDI